MQSGGHCHTASHCHDVTHMRSTIIPHHHYVITGHQEGRWESEQYLVITTHCSPLTCVRPDLVSLTHAARWCFTGTQPPLSLHLVAWPPHPAIIYLTLGQTLTLHIGTKWPRHTDTDIAHRVKMTHQTVRYSLATCSVPGSGSGHARHYVTRRHWGKWKLSGSRYWALKYPGYLTRSYGKHLTILKLKNLESNAL